MVTKINRRYSIFLVRFNAADSVSQLPEKVPRCDKIIKGPNCALFTPNAETADIVPLFVRENQVGDEACLFGRFGRNERKRTPIGQIGISSIETIGLHRAITAGLAHVMHHHKVSLVSNEAGKSNRFKI